METDYDVLGLAALPNDDELLPQIFAPDFMHLLNEADFLDEVPVVAQSTSLPVDPATTAAASGADMRPQMSPLFVPSSASDATAQPQQQLEGDLLVVTQQQEQGMLLFDQQLYRAASASSVGDGISAAGSPAHSAPGSPISSRPVSSSATTALKFGQQRSSSQPSPSAADDDTRTAVSAAIHLLQQQHQQQLRRSGQHQQWQQQQQQQSPAVSQACLPQEEKPLTNAQLAALKRKAPEVNWRSIQVGGRISILISAAVEVVLMLLFSAACQHVEPVLMAACICCFVYLAFAAAVLVDVVGLCWPGWFRIDAGHIVNDVMPE